MTFPYFGINSSFFFPVANLQQKSILVSYSMSYSLIWQLPALREVIIAEMFYSGVSRKLFLKERFCFPEEQIIIL